MPIVPIISAFFGDLSSSVFPSNMLISFGVAPAFLLGVALLAVGAALPPLAVIIAKCVELVLAYQFAVVRVFAIVQIPFPFAFDSFWAFALFYGAIVWFVIAYRKP